MARKDIDLSFILHGRQRIGERRRSAIFLFLKYGPYCLDYFCPGYHRIHLSAIFCMI